MPEAGSSWDNGPAEAPGLSCSYQDRQALGDLRCVQILQSQVVGARTEQEGVAPRKAEAEKGGIEG